jgi:hypothetical protein
MSEQLPPPDPPTPGGDSGRPPAADWTPAALSSSGSATYAGKTGHQQPSEAPGGHPPEISRFAPKRMLTPLLAVLVAAVVAGGVVYSATRPEPEPSPSLTPTASRVATPSASPRAGTRFVVRQSGSSGVWHIAEKRWTDKGLEALVELTLDSGDLTCYFNALDSNAQEVIRGDASDLTPQFPTGPIQTGATVRGWVFFPIERGTTLVFLRTVDQAQISGIEVTG